MTKKQIIAELEKIQLGIEADNFTWENIQDLKTKIVMED